MIRIIKKGVDFDLNDDTSISLEYASPIWCGDDVDAIGGIVAMPFSVPLTRHNSALLGLIQHLGNRKIKKSFENVRVLLDGNEHLVGTLEVEKINSTTLSSKIYSGVGGLQVFKEKDLNNSTLYSTDTTFDNDVTEKNASLTDGDILYLPFYDKDGNWVNEWNESAQTFVNATDSVAFVSAIYLLEKLIEGQGWTLVFKDKETFRYVIYLLTNQAETGSFTLSSILPSVKASDFIKELAIMTGHYIDVDNVRKILRFKKYSDLGKGSVLEWTDKVISVDGQEFLDISFYKDCANHTHTLKTESETITYAGGDIEYNRRFLQFQYDINSDTVENDNLDTISFIAYEGLRNSEVIYPLAGGNPGDIETLNYPYASSNSGVIDFLFDTNEGVLAKFQDWIDKIADSRLITMMINLKPNDIKNFKFNQIVTIFNSREGTKHRFIIKSIKQSISMQRHNLAEVELILLK